MRLSAAAIARLILVPALATTCSASESDPAPKRSEGRYFLELSEVMLTTSQFDVALGRIDPSGPRAGEPAEDLVADLSNPKAAPPRLTMGLNRPSGKTTVEFWVFDFHLKDERVPKSFNALDQVVSTTLLPPGVVFQRQRAGGSLTGANDDFVPNYGNEIAFIRRSDVRSGGLNLLHNIKEAERYRLRWLGGIKYAEIDQAVSARMSFTKEAMTDSLDVQDFFSVQAKVNTHGMGPNAGLDGRIFLDKKKRWSIEARGEAALLPESTSAQYLVSMVDSQILLITLPGVTPFLSDVPEAPIIPGIGSPGVFSDPFNAILRQQDFTEVTWLVEARIGLRWQVTRYFTVGLDAWQMRWTNLLTDIGVIDTIHRHATYEQILGDRLAGDPQLRDSESVLHAPRFTDRQTATWDGVALNMKFDF